MCANTGFNLQRPTVLEMRSVMAGPTTASRGYDSTSLRTEDMSGDRFSASATQSRPDPLHATPAAVRARALSAGDSRRPCCSAAS
jgi:hypothetical protein